MRYLLLTLLLTVGAAHAATLTGKVVAIADGDTLTVLDESKVQHKIRLAGIDAPEKAQPFGQASKRHLSDLVFGKTVEVEYTKKDKYGRKVGKVVLDGQDICLEQVKAGLAWHYKAYEREQSLEDRKLYDEAERAARGSWIGLWGDKDPVEPWEWRGILRAK